MAVSLCISAHIFMIIIMMMSEKQVKVKQSSCITIVISKNKNTTKRAKQLPSYYCSSLLYY
jgi:hypothetical protein